MPKRAHRVCAEIGCPELVSGRGNRCPPHAAELQRKERSRIAALPPSPRSAHYRSPAWRQRRARILRRDPVCRECAAARSTDVDHVV